MKSANFDADFNENCGISAVRMLQLTNCSAKFASGAETAVINLQLTNRSRTAFIPPRSKAGEPRDLSAPKFLCFATSFLLYFARKGDFWSVKYAIVMALETDGFETVSHSPSSLILDFEVSYNSFNLRGCCIQGNTVHQLLTEGNKTHLTCELIIKAEPILCKYRCAHKMKLILPIFQNLFRIGQ